MTLHPHLCPRCGGRGSVPAGEDTCDLCGGDCMSAAGWDALEAFRGNLGLDIVRARRRVLDNAHTADPYPAPDLGDLRSLAVLAADVLAPEVEPAEPVCLTCLGAGHETIAIGGPDRFGNWSTAEVYCSSCHGTGS